VGKGLRPPAGMQWKPGPTPNLLGPAPSSVPGAACSGLFKLLFTVAYTEGLGLDTSPARGHEETGRDEPLRQGQSKAPATPLPQPAVSPSTPPVHLELPLYTRITQGSHFQRFLLGLGSHVGKNLHSEQAPYRDIREFGGTPLSNPPLYPSPK